MCQHLKQKKYNKNGREGEGGSIEDFPNIRKITPEEKKEYLKKKEKGNGCLSIFMGFFAFAFGYLAVQGLYEVWEQRIWRERWAFALLCFGGLLLSAVPIISIVMMKREKHWIRKVDCFTAVGYSYQKKKERETDISDGAAYTVYYVKIWDGQSVYLSHWFPVEKKVYEREEPIEFNLYFYKDKSGCTVTDAYEKEM